MLNSNQKKRGEDWNNKRPSILNDFTEKNEYCGNNQKPLSSEDEGISVTPAPSVSSDTNRFSPILTQGRHFTKGVSPSSMSRTSEIAPNGKYLNIYNTINREFSIEKVTQLLSKKGYVFTKEESLRLKNCFLLNKNDNFNLFSNLIDLFNSILESRKENKNCDNTISSLIKKLSLLELELEKSNSIELILINESLNFSNDEINLIYYFESNFKKKEEQFKEEIEKLSQEIKNYDHDKVLTQEYHDFELDKLNEKLQSKELETEELKANSQQQFEEYKKEKLSEIKKLRNDINYLEECIKELESSELLGKSKIEKLELEKREIINNVETDVISLSNQITSLKEENFSLKKEIEERVLNSDGLKKLIEELLNEVGNLGEIFENTINRNIQIYEIRNEVLNNLSQILKLESSLGSNLNRILQIENLLKKDSRSNCDNSNVNLLVLFLSFLNLMISFFQNRKEHQKN